MVLFLDAVFRSSSVAACVVIEEESVEADR